MAVTEQRRAALLAGGGVLALALLAWVPTYLGDTWIYASTGRWVLDHGAIPSTDPFSWTFRGVEWQSNGWAWGLLLWAAFDLGGFLGVSLVKPVFVVAVGAAVWFAARALGARPGLAGAAAVLSVVGIAPWISDRPQLGSYLLLPLALGLAARATADDRLRWGWLAAIGACFVVWVNVHSVALFGVVVVGSFVGVKGLMSAMASRTLRPMVAPVLVVVTCGLATLVNPWGIGLISHSFVVTSKSSGTISEWYPVWKAGGIGVYTLVIIAAVGVVVALAKGWHRPDLLVPVVVCALSAVNAVRNTPLLVLVAACCVAPMITAELPVQWRARRGMAAVGCIVFLAAGVVLTTGRITTLTDPGDQNPVASADSLPAGCQLRNDYRLGGWVIARRPDVPVSADGRNDLFDPRGYDQNAWFESTSAAARAPADLLAEGTTCVLAMRDSPLVPALVDAGWVVTGEDNIAIALSSPVPGPDSGS